VANRPGNAIGWVFSAIALLAVLGALAEEYAGYAVRTRPGVLPGGLLAGWFSGWAWYPAVVLALVFTPLLFPDGRPPAPPWRLVSWLAAAVTALIVALAAVQPTIELDDGHVVDNPIGVAGVPDPELSVLNIVLGLLVVAAVVSLAVRFRRSRGDERLQLKWFTYACAASRCCSWETSCPPASATCCSPSGSPSRRSQPGSPSSATASTTSTG
jgi:hypothetical protein